LNEYYFKNNLIVFTITVPRPWPLQTCTKISIKTHIYSGFSGKNSIQWITPYG